MHISNVWLN